jgi:thiol-disulfide isomerase/thioredoxin
VIVVAIVYIVVALTGSTPKNPSATDRPAAPAALVSAVGTIPASVFNSVGLGAAVSNGSADPPFVKTTGQKPLSSGGKPQVVYVGGEYCPYCAIDRWALIAALSRFGTFSDLKLMSSSLSDSVSPGTPTFTFFNSTYTSPYFVFTPLEIENVNETTAGMPSIPAALDPVVTKYSSSTYFPTNTEGGIGFPFVDVGNQYIESGDPNWLDPSLIQHLSRAQIAAAMLIPSNVAAQMIDAQANYVAAGVCSIDGNMPTSVCTSSGVKLAAKSLSGLKPVK